MFCIYQMNDEKIIKILNIQDNFLLKVKEVISVEYVMLNDVCVDQIMDDINYGVGKYLLCNVNVIQLVEKVEIVNKGYIYNSTKYNVIVINTWKKLELTDTNIVNPLLQITNNQNMFQEYNIDQINNKSNFIIVGNNEDHKKIIVNKILDSIGETKIISITKNKHLLNNKNAIIYDEWDNDIINDFIDGRNGVIIFDNLVDFNTKFIKNNDFANLFYNNRHFNVKIIMTTPIKILSCFKCMADNIFVLQDVNYTCDKLYKYYYNEILPFNTFGKYFDKLNKDNVCMVTGYNEKPEMIYFYNL